MISSPAFQFKGTGWYATDYAPKGSGGDGDGAKPAAESPSAEKPAEKTEEKPKVRSKDVTPQKTEPPRHQGTKRN